MAGMEDGNGYLAPRPAAVPQGRLLGTFADSTPYAGKELRRSGGDYFVADGEGQRPTGKALDDGKVARLLSEGLLLPPDPRLALASLDEGLAVVPLDDPAEAAGYALAEEGRSELTLGFRLAGRLERGNVPEEIFECLKRTHWAMESYLCFSEFSEGCLQDLESLAGEHGVGLLLLGADGVPERVRNPRRRPRTKWEDVAAGIAAGDSRLMGFVRRFSEDGQSSTVPSAVPYPSTAEDGVPPGERLRLVVAGDPPVVPETPPAPTWLRPGLIASPPATGSFQVWYVSWPQANGEVKPRPAVAVVPGGGRGDTVLLMVTGQTDKYPPPRGVRLEEPFAAGLHEQFCVVPADRRRTRSDELERYGIYVGLLSDADGTAVGRALRERIEQEYGWKARDAAGGS